MEELISCKKAVAKVVAGAPNVSVFDTFTSQLNHHSASESFRVAEYTFLLFESTAPFKLLP
jgi:hypothetical protein